MFYVVYQLRVMRERFDPHLNLLGIWSTGRRPVDRSPPRGPVRLWHVTGAKIIVKLRRVVAEFPGSNHMFLLSLWRPMHILANK